MYIEYKELVKVIIRKPYAFLIKHFRIIHLILSIVIIFILTKTHGIFKFFNDYVKNGYYTYSANLQTSYINLYMFLSIVLIISLTSFVYLLMKWKKKNRILYISICTFYFTLFIGLLVYFNIFATILNTTLDVRTIRAYRDIIAILYIPQYLFLAFSLIRAIGFNIKKFDFQKDLEELDINEEDREEIEVTFGENNYKYQRKARQLIREIKYYIIENKFFFAAICGIITLILIFIVYTNLSVLNKKIKESEYFTIDGVIFKVTDSYILDTDYKGSIIQENNKYIIIKVNMENTSANRVILSTDSLRLVLDDETYLPTYSKNEYFKDIGEGYTKNTTLYPSEKYEYLMIFEIPKSKEFKEAVFRMEDSVSIIKGEISSNYKNVTLNLKNYLEKNEPSYYNLLDAISLEKSTLLNSEVLINRYEINDSFTENYTYCINSKCYNGNKIIKAETLGRDIRTILKLNIDLDLDESLYINRFITNNSEFITMFGSIIYKVNGTEKTYNITVKNLENIETSNIYMEVPEEIKNASEIKLKLTIRNQEYIINLK